MILFSRSALSFAACRNEIRHDLASRERKTDIDWIEWQATCIAPRILMPRQTFERVATKSINENSQYYRSTKAVYNQALHDIMGCYHVSYTSAAIRFQELGLARLLR